MKKIQLFIAASIDGYIARESGDIDWLFTDADYGYTEFLAGIDTIIMGRKTYQQVLTFGEYPYPGKKAFVLSKTCSGRDENVEFINDDWYSFVNNLREGEGENIWLVGGGETIEFFLKNNWLDELILAIHPIILGWGIPLVAGSVNLEKKFRLKNTIAYNSGLLQVFYDSI